MTQQRSARAKLRRLASAGCVVAAAGTMLALAGCSALFMSDEEALWRSTPSERHAIGFRAGLATLGVEMPPPGAALSANQETDLREFLAGFMAESTGPLQISVPTVAGDRGRAGLALDHVTAIAGDAGVGPGSIRVQRHSARAGAAGLQLSYARREAVPPDCYDWSEDLGRNHQRVPYPDFGCATQRNLALNVADPRHLQRPASEQPRASERRSADWTKYVGTTPGSGGGGQAGETKPKSSQKNAPAPIN